MDKISVVIITYNEERNIRRCLESVVLVADEIIVVDSLSDDKTKEICSEFNVSFHEQKFLGYIEQKNFALKFATHDFVLSVDADEALSEELAKSILEHKNSLQAAGYTMNRCTNYCGKWIYHGGWYPDRKLRLFKHKLGSWGGINPHDKFSFNDSVDIKHLKGDLLHYSYYTVQEHHLQNDRFSTIAAEHLYKRGKKYNILQHYFSPVLRFIRDYFINRGFLDGRAGLRISSLSAGSSFQKYGKLRELYIKARIK